MPDEARRNLEHPLGIIASKASLTECRRLTVGKGYFFSVFTDLDSQKVTGREKTRR